MTALALVTGLYLRNTRDGIEVEVSARRMGFLERWVDMCPDVNDVPADIREALRAWLDTAVPR